MPKLPYLIRSFNSLFRLIQEMGFAMRGMASASDLTRMDLEQPCGSLDSGEARLEALGYRQELHRKFNMYDSFAVSVVLMCNIGGITGALGFS